MMDNQTEFDQLVKFLDLPPTVMINLEQLAKSEDKTLKNFIKETLINVAQKNQLL